jgi:hypothetical protein
MTLAEDLRSDVDDIRNERAVLDEGEVPSAGWLDPRPGRCLDWTHGRCVVGRCLNVLEERLSHPAGRMAT